MKMDYRHLTIGLIVLLGAGLFVGYTDDSVSEAAAFNEATVYYSPDCGCCTQHISYLERAGVEVERVEMNSRELSQLKEDKGIPGNYQSCHTTEIGDRFVEGHVPVSVFNELVEEEPEIDGITLPGMPSGSPGMPGPKTETWNFHAVEDGEVAGEFTTR